jgi:hypothetical protein
MRHRRAVSNGESTPRRGIASLWCSPVAIASSVKTWFRAAFLSRQSVDGDQEIDLEASEGSSRSNNSGVNSFYLTCVPSGSRLPDLSQIDATTIDTDLKYFDHLRDLIKRHNRSWRGILNPRKVLSVQYVKFELLFDNTHVEVRQTPGYPEDEQEYRPCKADFEKDSMLPWGSNTLLHFLEQRHQCVEYPQILRRIPVKLKERLATKSDGSALLGWGMHLVDGVDTLRIGILGIYGLIVSSLLGVLWAKLHSNDIQGGTGLTQCLMAFVTFLITMHGLVGFVEQRQ